MSYFVLSYLNSFYYEYIWRIGLINMLSHLYSLKSYEKIQRLRLRLGMGLVFYYKSGKEKKTSALFIQIHMNIYLLMNP